MSLLEARETFDDGLQYAIDRIDERLRICRPGSESSIELNLLRQRLIEDMADEEQSLDNELTSP